MSCKHELLVNAALRRLSLAPSTLLEDLVREFHVSRRTLQNAIIVITRKTFRELRDEVLVDRANSLLESDPTRGIKELSFALGYKSPRSFARAIKRACGNSPTQLRARKVSQRLQVDKQTVLPEETKNKKG